MVVPKGLRSIKRFGTRYGRTNKAKVAKIEAETKKAHKCPYCSRIKVHRVCFGIWSCDNCKAKFTARAYTVGSKSSLTEESVQLVAESPILKQNTVEEDEN